MRAICVTSVPVTGSVKVPVTWPPPTRLSLSEPFTLSLGRIAARAITRSCPAESAWYALRRRS